MTENPDEDLVVAAGRRAVMELQADLAIARALRQEQHLWTFMVTYAVFDELLDKLEAQDHSSQEALSKDHVLGPPRLACLLCDVGYQPSIRKQRCGGPLEEPTVQRCRHCGCTNENACIDVRVDPAGRPCSWVTADVCSACT